MKFCSEWYIHTKNTTIDIVSVNQVRECVICSLQLDSVLSDISLKVDPLPISTCLLHYSVGLLLHLTSHQTNNHKSVTITAQNTAIGADQSHLISEVIPLVMLWATDRPCVHPQSARLWSWSQSAVKISHNTTGHDRGTHILGVLFSQCVTRIQLA